ncbi:FAD-dependent oxidoreductase [Microbacterium schleiferi]|uniref:FAD-dependent oxidoreductase n=1 Tax=Microbacterium schleiferi TaxID=69362 RepID=A0A7S8RGQ8_9MICO|nr:FAD-dependent oxidoreductase [Microbacterium schleiferi]QPE03817.1 FAD-dependent oxidoreductase [Microbacterium schleiferi]
MSNPHAEAAADVDLCIVGGGIAGLVVAVEASAAGLRTVVLERSARVGGMLAPAAVGDGILVDAGAESFATRTDAVPALIAQLSLPVEIVEPDPTGAWLVVSDEGGAVRRAPLPSRSILGIPADPAAEDVRALVPGATEKILPVPASEPSFHALVADRLGAPLAATIVDTVCRGVYSTPADRLQLSRIHPQLWARFQQSGSLTAAVADLVTTGARPGSAVAGIRGGLWRLADALAARARAQGVMIETETTVAQIDSADSGVTVRTMHGTVRAGALVLATGRAEIDRLTGDGQSAPQAPVHLAIARLHAPALDRHPVGTGALVADAVPGQTKAMTHANAKWEWLDEALPPHEHLVRVSARDAETARFDEESVAADASRITGVSLAPGSIRELRVGRWDAASASGAEPPAPRPGVHLTGAAVAGTGLAAVIPHARAVAADVIAAHALAPAH